MTKDEALREAIDTLKSTKHGNCDFAWIDETLKKCTEALAQPPLPVQEPVAYDKTEMNSFVIDLYDKKMQEGKHGHYETMFHVVHQAIKRVTLPLPVQEPKKRCCDHDSDCAIHNGDALPVGPCDCSQTFISSPDLGIVVTVSHQLAVRELAALVAENFGQMPRNDKWADKVLLVRDTFEAARNKGAKP